MRQLNGIVDILTVSGLVNRTVNKGNVFDRKSAVQSFRDLYDTAFAHAVHNKIRTGIQKDRTFHPARPVIVMSESAQARLDAADQDRGMFIGLPYQVAVNDRRIVRALSHHTARGKGIHVPSVFGHRIMIYHGVHVSRSHKKTETRLTKDRNAVLIPPVRL